MADIEHDRTASAKGSTRRVALIAACVVAIGLIAASLIGGVTEPEPTLLGVAEGTDASPVIVTDPATGAEAPLSGDAQGATRVELGSTPETTID
ncbi:hypothetical protein [Jannaschia seohaensis]|uniref:Uncharacterized protein n=1 Tax=Jannaschia seohaensis TaxID=475081 RepID=A0A2Y9B7L2_9RHOB|nr:hypothetical protein [Jannaschia seohaensis]PWJ10927.1 hypothetical protein BCF38_12132 [Jannaschia seohaensis]SSA51528.1 hypothetical protein SAMN05421539_12132 [Jannaschia seohaensis]